MPLKPFLQANKAGISSASGSAQAAAASEAPGSLSQSSSHDVSLDITDAQYWSKHIGKVSIRLTVNSPKDAQSSSVSSTSQITSASAQQQPSPDDAKEEALFTHMQGGFLTATEALRHLRSNVNNINSSAERTLHESHLHHHHHHHHHHSHHHGHHHHRSKQGHKQDADRSVAGSTSASKGYGPDDEPSVGGACDEEEASTSTPAHPKLGLRVGRNAKHILVRQQIGSSSKTGSCSACQSS